MVEKGISPDSDLARKILDELWMMVTREETAETDADIDRLIGSRFVAIRFCLPTQLLGKLTDGRLDCLCLQKGKGDDERLWDPRSFANKVIVPWVAENQSVLGTSADPYVGKPLRRPRLEADPGNVKGREEWQLLFKILNDVQARNSPTFTRCRMVQTLRSIDRRFAELAFEYYVPERISLEQTERLVATFLSESSGGDRGLAVAAALFETFGEYFKIYKEVRRCVVNASDESTGLAGDIECIGEDGKLRLAVEVKERSITLTDVRGAIRKARKISLQEILFSAPGASGSEAGEISELIAKTWGSGTNLYRLSIGELISVGLSLTGEEGRRRFVELVGKQVDTYSTQPANRQRWKELLEGI